MIYVTPIAFMKNQVTPWKVLAGKNFGLFWFSLLVSSIGTQVAQVTIAWQIYEITDSPLQLGLTGLFRIIPLAIFSLSGGVMADRMNRRKLMIITQGAAMIFALALGLLTTSGYIQVWHIYAITFLTTAAGSIDSPARSALIPNLVPREHLTTAFALNVTLRQSATLVGPFLGGIVIAGLGIAPSYYINALSFLAVIFSLMLMQVTETRSAAPRQPALKSMREGLGFVRENPAILGLMIMDTCVNFFGAYRSMMPVFARDLLNVGPQGLGALLGAPAFGALLGSAFAMMGGNPKHKVRRAVIVTLAYAVGLIFFALSRSFALSLSVAFVLGMLDAIGETLRVTIIQLATPDQLRGRVQSLAHLFATGGPHLGQVQLGATAALMGAPAALLLGGVIAVMVISALARKVSRLRE
jgi:MFS family permease